MTFEVKLHVKKNSCLYYVYYAFIPNLDFKQIRYWRKNGFLNKKTTYVAFFDIWGHTQLNKKDASLQY